MALAQRSEFAAALNQICAERGIEPEVVLDTIKTAVLAAYRKDYGESEGLEVEIDSESGEVAIKNDKNDVTPPGFGRIAAQTAKQVILQRVREAEKNAIFAEYQNKINTVVSGLVQRISGPIITVDLGKAEGIMPPQEQVPHEFYRINQRMKFFVVGIQQGNRGEEIIVSRSKPGLVEQLFKSEVPEIAAGSVVIRAIAREPGSRTKVAVLSTQPNVDPVGSCVGQKGVRVQAVISEIGDEKIDIVPFDEDLEKFVTAALSPAKDVQVKVEEKEGIAYVTVPDDQLSLAIGKEGQNVRLAAKLTGLKIDIKGQTEAKTKEAEIPAEVVAKEAKGVGEAKKTAGLSKKTIEKKVTKKAPAKKVAKSKTKKAKSKEDESKNEPAA
ncbi:MAG TPA: transcription termination factor NusA [Patescibacteria group bacterium]